MSAVKYQSLGQSVNNKNVFEAHFVRVVIREEKSQLVIQIIGGSRISKKREFISCIMDHVTHTKATSRWPMLVENNLESTVFLSGTSRQNDLLLLLPHFHPAVLGLVLRLQAPLPPQCSIGSSGAGPAAGSSAG